MKKRIYFLISIFAVVCMVAFGVAIYTNKPKDVITENSEETYYLYEETELGTELNPSSENYAPTESIIEKMEAVSSENQTEEVNAVNLDELADVFGISIFLPENPNWIVNSEYHLIDDNNLEITYHDLIADSDCVILVAKNENLTLPENEYDERLDESWEGRTINGQNIVVKVQRGKNDSKAVLATWEYNEYQFAIIGEIEGELDSGPIAKVALFIIENLN